MPKGKQGFQKGNPSINTGRTRFKKGNAPPKHKKGCKCFRCSHIPWNKGTKGICKAWNKDIKGLYNAWNKGIKLPKFSGKNHPNWKGGKTKDRNGYVFIFQPDHPFAKQGGYVREHRLVIEQQIGRYLKKEETGHHLGEKTDNRPQMLMAFVNNSAHQRFEKNPDNVKPEEIIFDGRKIH